MSSLHLPEFGDLRTWLAELRYREIHALVWGFGLAGGATVATQFAPETSVTLATVATTVLVWAFTGRVADAADDRRGTSGASGPTGRGIPSAAVLAKVYRDPHFYVAGLVAGTVAGAALLVLLPIGG